MKKGLFRSYWYQISIYLIADFHEAGNHGGAQGNFTDYHSQFDENYQIQQYHEEIRNHYAQQSGGHVSSTQHSLQSSTQQSSTSSCKYSNQCADKMGQYPGSIFQHSMESQGCAQTISCITTSIQNTITNSSQNTINNSTQNTQPLTSATLENQSIGETPALLKACQSAQAKALKDPDNLYRVLDGYQHDKSPSNLKSECNQTIDNPGYANYDQHSSNLCSIQSMQTSVSTNSLQHSSSQSTIIENQQNLSNIMQHSSGSMQHSHSTSSLQSFSSMSESSISDTGPVVNWHYSPLQHGGADVLQTNSTNSTMHSVLSSSSLCSSSNFVTRSGISESVVQQSSTIHSDSSSLTNTALKFMQQHKLFKIIHSLIKLLIAYLMNDIYICYIFFKCVFIKFNLSCNIPSMSR